MCRLLVPYTCLLCFFFVLGSLLFQLGVRAFGGGGLLTLRRFSASSVILHRRSSECGIMLPSGLLVWQIPYREMRSLGLKVSIHRGSRLPCLVLRGYQGARRDSQLVRAVPDSTVGYLGRDWLGLARALLSDGPLDCTHPSVLRACCVGAHGKFHMAVLLVGCCLFRVWGLPSSSKCC